MHSNSFSPSFTLLYLRRTLLEAGIISLCLLLQGLIVGMYTTQIDQALARLPRDVVSHVPLDSKMLEIKTTKVEDARLFPGGDCR